MIVRSGERQRVSFTEKKRRYNAKYKNEGEPPSAHIIKNEKKEKKHKEPDASVRVNIKR